MGCVYAADTQWLECIYSHYLSRVLESDWGFGWAGLGRGTPCTVPYSHSAISAVCVCFGSMVTDEERPCVVMRICVKKVCLSVLQKACAVVGGYACVRACASVRGPWPSTTAQSLRSPRNSVCVCQFEANNRTLRALAQSSHSSTGNIHLFEWKCAVVSLSTSGYQTASFHFGVINRIHALFRKAVLVQNKTLLWFNLLMGQFFVSR